MLVVPGRTGSFRKSRLVCLFRSLMLPQSFAHRLMALLPMRHLAPLHAQGDFFQAQHDCPAGYRRQSTALEAEHPNLSMLMPPTRRCRHSLLDGSRPGSSMPLCGTHYIAKALSNAVCSLPHHKIRTCHTSVVDRANGLQASAQNLEMPQ